MDPFCHREHEINFNLLQKLSSGFPSDAFWSVQEGKEGHSEQKTIQLNFQPSPIEKGRVINTAKKKQKIDSTFYVSPDCLY